jgi:Ankyrin repeats (3 copies)/Ankyrin repeat
LILAFFALLILLGLPTTALQLAHMSWDGYALSTAPAGAAFAVALAAIWGITWAVRSIKRALTGNSEQLPPSRWALKAVSLVIIVGLGVLGHVLFPHGLSLGAYLGRTPNTAQETVVTIAEVATTEVAVDAARPAATVVDGATDAVRTAGSTVLIDAVRTGASAEQLIDLVAAGHSIDDQDSQGRTAVHVAAARNDEVALRTLLKLNGNATVVDRNEQTPLHFAAKQSAQLLPVLLAHIAKKKYSVNETDSQGQTALMLAAASGNEEAVNLLLKAGAKTRITDQESQTAYDLAKRNGHAKIAQLLAP